MPDLFDPLENLWVRLLSRDPDQVREIFATLDPESRKAVLDHLQHMADEDGWHPEQCLSAQQALEALRESHG